MSSLLRRLPLSRLLLLCAAVVLVGVACTALASALGGDPKPAPKPLPQAIHDALTAPKTQGFSAHVKFSNHLVEGASLESQEGTGGANPLLSGAEGRVWISADGHVRLELQSESGATQILYDGTTLTVYQASANTLYRYTPPPQQGAGEGEASGASEGEASGASEGEASGAGNREASGAGEGEAAGGDVRQVPSVARIQDVIMHLMGHADLTGAMPTDVAGEPAYAVRISPKSNGGLVGGAELAWDANHGVPLKLAVYAKGNDTPVLALTATEVSYGAVPDSVFSLSLPSGVKTTQIGPPAGSSGAGGNGRHPHIDARTTGLGAVQAKLPFKLQAPATLAGMSRHEVRLIEVDGHDSALIGYGEGLGGIVVIESQANGGEEPGQPAGSSQLGLPRVSIDGAKATELPTALGTLLSFQSDGVDHVLAGSVTPPVLQAAARGL